MGKRRPERTYHIIYPDGSGVLTHDREYAVRANSCGDRRVEVSNDGSRFKPMKKAERKEQRC